MKRIVYLLVAMIAWSDVGFGQDAEPPYGRSHLEAYSIFTDAIRNNDHEMALMYGLWMLEAKPREMPPVTTFRLDRQFERLIDVYIDMAGEESDPTEKRNHLAEADKIFDLTFETFEEDEINLFRWHHKRGRFYQENHSNLDAGLSDAFEWYEKAYNEDMEAFVESGGGYYVRILLSQLINTGERQKAMQIINDVEEIADADLLNDLDEFREQLFESPEERIAFIESRMDAAEGSEKEEMLKTLIDLYDETGQREKTIDTARELYEMNPNFENTKRVADMLLSDGEYESAVPVLGELLELSESDEQSIDVLLELSETHRQLNDLQTARSYARRAIELGSDGEGNLRISEIYASAISQCTGGQALERNDRTVYWLVIDYLEKALEGDSSLRSTVERRIETYREAMPTVPDKFFREWEDGDSFMINGSIGECYAWIDEETTVK